MNLIIYYDLEEADERVSFADKNPFEGIDGASTEEIFGQGRFLRLAFTDVAEPRVQDVIRDQKLGSKPALSLGSQPKFSHA